MVGLVCCVVLVLRRIWNLGEVRVLDNLVWVVVKLIRLLDSAGVVELGRCGGIRQSMAWMKAGRGSAEHEGENVGSSSARVRPRMRGVVRFL